METQSYIVWNASPEIIQIGSWALRWYGLLFASGFLLSHAVLKGVFRSEGRPIEDLDRLTFYIVFGVVLGARLGHCLFYEPMEYLTNPLEILKVWKGGLASHGAAIGILIAIWLFSKNSAKPSNDTKNQATNSISSHTYTFTWVIDRLCIVIPGAGALVRLGNLMNSEIYGKVTDVPWAFVFVQDPSAGLVPRHPSQLYEAVVYAVLFGVMVWLYYRRKAATPAHLLSGVMITALFTARLLLEFFKEPQEAYDTLIPLNTGQLLSVPFIILGIYLLLRSQKPQNTQNMTQPSAL